MENTKKITAIDCFKLQKGVGKSIGIYIFAQKLVHQFAKEPSNNKIIVFGNSKNRNDFDIDGVDFVELTLNPQNKVICIWWELFGVKILIRKYHITKTIFPRGFAPIGNGKNYIVVIHDMIPFYYHENFPDALNKLENFYIMKRLVASIRHSGQVVTISEYSRNEIERIVPKAGKKTEVILHGVDKIVVDEAVHPLNTEYILGITSKLPHKNTAGILTAYSVYRKQVESPLPLVLIGISEPHDFVDDLDEETYRHIICYQYLNDYEFYSWFKHAKCLVFLSLTEGFGFPPLEAMQFGVPVVLSNRASLPEIAGTAAILVDPTNPMQVANALKVILSDNNLRLNLIEAGRLNVKRFSWDCQIKRYLELID